VVLQPINGDESTDYINANWVKDMFDKKRYISTQGPIRRVSDYEQENVDTCPDFWRMVWENNVETIVMLTKKSEDMRETEKCSLYWPKMKGESTRYGDIDVTTTEKKKEKNITFRHFRIQRGDVIKECEHIQYTGWPDHGVPSDEDEFIYLTEKVDEIQKSENPMIVHCSAGIGRSGTFCAIHSYVRYLRHFYKEHNDLPDINVPKRLIELRKDRPKMIQTKEQYEFVYKAIYKVFRSIFDEFEAKRAKNVPEEEKKDEEENNE